MTLKALAEALTPGWYLKCGSHFMAVHNYETGYLTMNTCDPEFARFDTEQEALQVRDAAIAKLNRCPSLDVVEIGECEACESIGPVVHILGIQTLCERCAEPNENACEACGHQDGTHEEHGRWLCDDCADEPEDNSSDEGDGE